ncbi:hypothetical protein K443DRAFT_5667 [Laccaria amethystina LaAM-08-1]|uniref:Uncharacterized protein n=1 Tax=Laccaria amethystina LaAM-08-1 TaxID=1095629 RepID=A0A0C9XNN3_9AGAR|nr:hypothetical protein K443DRAFT_5667 [Laccaria amethystina LaAM-08-1]
MSSRASSPSESERWQDARTSLGPPSPSHEGRVDSNIKRYTSTVFQGRYGSPSAMSEGALHLPPRTGSPASDQDDHRSAHTQLHYTTGGSYTPSSVLQNAYGHQAPQNNRRFHRGFTSGSKSDSGFPTFSHGGQMHHATGLSSKNPDLYCAKSDHGSLTYSRTHPSPLTLPTQRSGHRPFFNESTSPSFPILNRPGLSPLRRLSPEAQQPHHDPETNSNYPPSAILQEIYGSSARQDGSTSAGVHSTSTRPTPASFSTRPIEIPPRQREKQTAEGDDPSEEDPLFRPPATSKESQQAQSQDKGKQKEGSPSSQRHDTLGRCTSNRPQPSSSQTAHLDAPAAAVSTGNIHIDDDGDFSMGAAAESLQMGLFNGSQANQSPPPPSDREIQPPSCQSRHIRPQTTRHRPHQNVSPWPTCPEFGASLDRGMEPASHQSTHTRSKSMCGPSPSQAGPSTTRPRTGFPVVSSRRSLMTTPQDHEMEFLWGASKYRCKRREHRTPGNSGEPRERHDTGYDGEEEDPDQDRFDDAGDQFARQTPQEENNEDMFGDKGGQYSDEAEEGGDKLDSNDLYPDHEAELEQEGMEDSENAHQASPPICSFWTSVLMNDQHFVTHKELERHINTINSNVNAINDNMNTGFSRIFSLLEVANGSPSHTRSTKRGKRRGPKISGLPKRRTAAANAMAANVRRHFRQLMQSRTLFAFMASNDDVFEFETIWKANGGTNAYGRTPPCCTIDDFRVDLVGLPRSPWNISASHVFCMDFIRYQGLAISDALYDDVLYYFYTRIKGLKAAYAESQLLRGARSKRKQVRRRWQRKRATFLRRLEIADSHHLLQAHVPILQQLGVDGMSSDESDLEELERDPSVRQRRPRFFVRSLLWRKRGLSAWLRVFDAMHIYERRSSGVNLRGAYPRYRVHKIDHFSQSKKFVSHLPLSAYDGTWLEGHEDLNFTVCPNNEETYDFTHHPDVHDLVDVTITNAPEVIMPFY